GSSRPTRQAPPAPRSGARPTRPPKTLSEFAEGVSNPAAADALARGAKRGFAEPMRRDPAASEARRAGGARRGFAEPTRRGPGASEARSARSARALDGPPDTFDACGDAGLSRSRAAGRDRPPRGERDESREHARGVPPGGGARRAHDRARRSAHARPRGRRDARLDARPYDGRNGPRRGGHVRTPPESRRGRLVRSALSRRARPEPRRGPRGRRAA